MFKKIFKFAAIVLLLALVLLFLLFLKAILERTGYGPFGLPYRQPVVVESAQGVEVNEQLVMLLRGRDSKAWCAESELPEEVQLDHWMCYVTEIKADNARIVITAQIMPVGRYSDMAAIFNPTLEETYELQEGRLALLSRKELPFGYVCESAF